MYHLWQKVFSFSDDKLLTVRASCICQLAAHPTLVFTARVKSRQMDTSAPVTLFGREQTVVSTDYDSFGFSPPCNSM